jgi:gamma-glutamyltranspeptidase/glutathione hydrolase
VATRAGLAVLQRGGNAADAAVAVAFVLAVVHPHSGNLGGGGLLTYFDADAGAVWTLDFRETAPAAADRKLFEATPDARRIGALAAGVPGTVAGLGELHRKFGSEPWAELLRPAIALAEEGFTPDADLREAMQRGRERGVAALNSTSYLRPGEGERVVPEELAATLRMLASGGPGDFYHGALSKRLVEGVHASGGLLSLRDLRGYQAIWRAPLEIEYRGLRIYAPPAPSSGGVVLAETLGILAGDDLGKLGHPSVRSLHLILESQRRAHLDALRYLADPASSRLPYRELLSAERAKRWRQTIEPGRVVPNSYLASTQEPQPSGEHTTHFTIADTAGNVLSLTTSLGDDFGGGVIVPGVGFPLNNAMKDFAETATPNAFDSGKRPVTPLAPLIVLRGQKPYLAIGSSGGTAIAPLLLRIVVDITALGRPLIDAIAEPRACYEGAPEAVAYEQDLPREIIEGLNALGHPVKRRESIGDVHAILFEDGRMTAVADPRHGGAAGGI